MNFKIKRPVKLELDHQPPKRRGDKSTSTSSPTTSSPSLVVSNLYIGSHENTQLDTILKLDISYILSLSKALPKFIQQQTTSSSALVVSSTGVGNSNKQVKLPSEDSSHDYHIRLLNHSHQHLSTNNNNTAADHNDTYKLIKVKCINILDSLDQKMDQFFDETLDFIDDAKRNKCNILVHCKAGISRSPTIAIAYLMKLKQINLQDAYQFVKRCRPQISPNLNFMGQLVSFENRLIKSRLHSQLLHSADHHTTRALVSPIKVSSFSNAHNATSLTSKQSKNNNFIPISVPAANALKRLNHNQQYHHHSHTGGNNSIASVSAGELIVIVERI